MYIAQRWRPTPSSIAIFCSKNPLKIVPFITTPAADCRRIRELEYFVTVEPHSVCHEQQRSCTAVKYSICVIRFLSCLFNIISLSNRCKHRSNVQTYQLQSHRDVRLIRHLQEFPSENQVKKMFSHFRGFFVH